MYIYIDTNKYVNKDTKVWKISDIVMNDDSFNKENK